MKTFQPADHLRSRTFIGLLIAQFLAAFNDQAIHAAAMFYAINTKTMTERAAIGLMPVLFYAPWAIFCTVAGYYADRYSKRNALVLWKIVEVGITLIATAGFWLGRQAGYEFTGSWIVLSTVFLMGMHSAFFVPAKYGAMPEILTPRMLSRGNGVLESLSFLAVILGTVSGGVLSWMFGGHEYLIGLILTALAVVGALASLFIERMPAANPSRAFPPYIYQPLIQNVRLLLTSRPLVFAVVGIAFFTFLVAYMRTVVYMHGQSQLPQWDEAKTSYIVGMVALGIGLGSPLVGYLSGGKVEVGLVPIGAVGMILATSVAALYLNNIPVLVTCIVFMGFFTGFYLVPLFSLLQHRAPKASKGDSIATSNLINITGAIAATAVFTAVTSLAIRTGYTPALAETAAPKIGRLESRDYDHGDVSRVVVEGRTYKADSKGPSYVVLDMDLGLTIDDDVAVRTYGTRQVTYYRFQKADATPTPVYDLQRLPSLLFLGAGAMTLLTLGVLWWILPDLFRRTMLWFRSQGRYQMELAGMLRLPGNGSAVIVTDAATSEAMTHLERAADRVLVQITTGTSVARSASDARYFLSASQVVTLSVMEPGLVEEVLRSETGVPVLPVHHADVTTHGKRHIYIVAGNLLTPGCGAKAVKAELERVREDISRRLQSGEPLEKEAVEH